MCAWCLLSTGEGTGQKTIGLVELLILFKQLSVLQQSYAKYVLELSGELLAYWFVSIMALWVLKGRLQFTRDLAETHCIVRICLGPSRSFEPPLLYVRAVSKHIRPCCPIITCFTNGEEGSMGISEEFFCFGRHLNVI